MEEGVLCLVHTDQFLDIIQDQYIDVLIEVQEIVGRILTNGIGKLDAEQVGRYIQHPFLRMQFADTRSDRIAQVGLAHTGGTPDEHGVIGGLTRISSNLFSCRTD